MIDWNDVAHCDPNELRTALKEHFTVAIPMSIETIDDMKEAQMSLGRIASQYSYLMALNVEIKGLKRRMKREKAEKEKVDDMMEREELLTTYTEILKMAYNSISRMISVRTQVYEELKMTNSL